MFIKDNSLKILRKGTFSNLNEWDCSIYDQLEHFLQFIW